MSFIRILPNETFELWTDIRELRSQYSGSEFQAAFKEAIPYNDRKFDPNKKCWILKNTELIKTVKDLCETYFKDDWKTKDLRHENPAAYIRHLMFLHEECPIEIVETYFIALCDKDCQQLGPHSFQLISETYDRAYKQSASNTP